MIIYIDKDYKCHATKKDGTRAFEVAHFDNKCVEFIEGYRYIPSGESWTNEDGRTFHGELISPWKNHEDLIAFQRKYEQEKLEEYITALSIIGATI